MAYNTVTAACVLDILAEIVQQSRGIDFPHVRAVKPPVYAAHDLEPPVCRINDSEGHGGIALERVAVLPQHRGNTLQVIGCTMLQLSKQFGRKVALALQRPERFIEAAAQQKQDC